MGKWIPFEIYSLFSIQAQLWCHPPGQVQGKPEREGKIIGGSGWTGRWKACKVSYGIVSVDGWQMYLYNECCWGLV